jgi:adenosine deaminase
MDLADTIRALPKAELHLHLDGSVRPETAVELAADAGIELTLDEARSRMIGPERCADQAELLRFFDLPIALLQTREALQRVSGELVDDLAADGVRYAEIRWAPRLHLERGLGVAEVIEAVAAGIASRAAARGPRTPLVGLVVTAMRSHPPAANVELASLAAAFGHPVVGFDLAGPEAAYPAPPHALAFLTARDAGLELTAHAGEIPGPGRVRETLDFGVRRIAHGVTAQGDPDLLAILRERDITLDLCPTSNVQAGIVRSVAEHPVAELHRAGVSVTISTDDRTVTGTTLTAELARCAAELALTPTELAAVTVNAFRRGFAPAGLRQPFVEEARAAWTAWAEGASIS